MTIRQSPFSIVPVEAAFDHRLTAMQYRVLISILSFRNKNTDTCYPKRESIAARCGYSVGNVSKVTAQLVDMGWLRKVGRGGRSMPTTYQVTVPETVSNPETVSDLETVSNPASKTVSNPDAKTVSGLDRGKEQTKEQTKEQKKRSTRANGIDRPAGVSEEVWRDALAHRVKIKAPLSTTAWRRMEPELRALEAEGWNPDDVIGEWLANGWRAFKADWIRKRCEKPARTQAEDHWE